MSIFSATLGSFGSISFLSLSHSHSQQQQQQQQHQQQPDPFNFPKFPHKLQYYRSKIMMVSSSNNTNNTHIDEVDNGLLQRPSAPNSLDTLRQARVCLSSTFHSL
jgi:hypothetical protein